MRKYEEPSRLTAILGPTNTGKTHLAVERMLAHRTGMMGFPLRLLAREIYDRVVAAKGEDAAALITGEEKIIPPRPQYFLCTVESMPLDREVDFLAVDEIQLAADRERGHIFTDRLLHARGEVETMFLGAGTIAATLRTLVPEAAIISRPRLSELSHGGRNKLSRLPPRSAIIAFSAQSVYEIAEAMRSHAGGCAVVLGALSPRTRNAQVAMYQAGEIDHMVATDAIGMGLNMDLDHVAFSADRKFDGRQTRKLSAAEMAQIAGRAGRYLNNGTFGATGDLEMLNANLVEAIEAHRFPGIRDVFWRNSDLHFDSIEGLLSDLDMPSPAPNLKRVQNADDHLALTVLARDAEVADIARAPQMVGLLWDACRIPDFRKTLAEHHIGLVRQIFMHVARRGRLPPRWVEQQIARFDQTGGDIDTLTARISHVRTWTYIAHHPGWLDDAEAWQIRTRDIEDKLSDALHARLTQRFVNKRAAALSQSMRRGDRLLSSVADDGEIMVEGERVGRLAGFRFAKDTGVDENKAVASAAHRVLEDAMARRVQMLVASPAEAFSLGLGDGGELGWGEVGWHGEPVARLVAGGDVLRPGLKLVHCEHLNGPQRERVRARVDTWLREYLDRVVAPLRLIEAAPLNGTARGLAFQVVQSLGTLPRAAVTAEIQALSKPERQELKALGITLGSVSVYVSAMLKASRMAPKALLRNVFRADYKAPSLPNLAAVSISASDKAGEPIDAVPGYILLGTRAMRADVAERLAVELRRRARRGPIEGDRALLLLAHCKKAELSGVLKALGYVAQHSADGAAPLFVPAPGKAGRRVRRGARRGAAEHNPHSPFAMLGEMAERTQPSRRSPRK